MSDFLSNEYSDSKEYSEEELLKAAQHCVRDMCEDCPFTNNETPCVILFAKNVIKLLESEDDCKATVTIGNDENRMWRVVENEDDYEDDYGTIVNYGTLTINM